MLEELTIRKAIEFAIATEQMGMRAYAKLAEAFSDEEEMSEVFSLLAKDEQAHAAQFQTLLKSVPSDPDVIGDDEQIRYLRAMAMSEFLGGDAGLVGGLEKPESLDQVLVHVLGFEKATLGYYLAVREILGESEPLESIIKAEKSHIARLMKYILTDEKMKELADRF